MDNQDKITGFSFWTDRLTWQDLTDTWENYNDYLYYRMKNQDK